MHKLTVTLKQHTPLIHFQHDQEGATLRASEVKPKLDKFILMKLGGDDGYEAGIQIAKENGWLVGKGDHPALDYKMRIKAEGTCFKKHLKIINAERESVVYENILLQINAKEYMARLLAQYLSPFFVVHNFGYRQSKGYGSFTVESLLLDDESQPVANNIIATLRDFYFNELAVLYNFNEYENFSEFSFDLKKYCNIPENVKLTRYGKLPLNEPLNGVFEDIDGLMDNLKKRIKEKIKSSPITEDQKKEYIETLLTAKLKQIENDVRYNFYEVLFSKFIDQDYQKYKQGTREDSRNNVKYDKAVIWHYFNELEQTGNVVYWEKRAIKQKINSLNANQLCGYSLKNDHLNQPYNELHEQDSDKQHYHYIRAILGLAETFEFQTNDRNVKFVVNVSNCDTDKVERMQSAIFFKVVDNNIYMCLQRPEKVREINGKEFKLELSIVKEQNKRKIKLNKEPIDLGRIDTPNFDIDSLYQNILNFYRNNDYEIK